MVILVLRPMNDGLSLWVNLGSETNVANPLAAAFTGATRFGIISSSSM
jgi:hypothetical protein